MNTKYATEPFSLLVNCIWKAHTSIIAIRSYFWHELIKDFSYVCFFLLLPYFHAKTNIKKSKAAFIFNKVSKYQRQCNAYKKILATTKLLMFNHQRACVYVWELLSYRTSALYGIYYKLANIISIFHTPRSNWYLTIDMRWSHTNKSLFEIQLMTSGGLHTSHISFLFQ